MLCLHTNLLIIFLQNVNKKHKTEPGSEKLTKYCCGTPTVNKPVGNLTTGLHKWEDNKSR